MGNVIRIWHQVDDKTIVESLYAHCDKILIKEERFVKQGEKIGTIGNAGGIYLAHLHFEIRDSLFLPIRKGYSVFTEGYLNPTLFIKSHR
ncbi:M23 family metallopeptidase [Aquimarina sp. 2201CG1-2-11]|uniref:M23 family metallopeptidase n=1 Tax=Aquimarina discodermiae TaxID=3231043 RepID=UPI003462C498